MKKNKQKKKKCEECHEIIEKEAWYKGKKVCQFCYKQLRDLDKYQMIKPNQGKKLRKLKAKGII